MGRKARKALQTELTGQTEQEAAERARTTRGLRRQARGFLRGEFTPEVEAAQSTWRTLEDQLANRLARTRNVAGYGATMEEFGRQKARDVADVTRRGRLYGVDILKTLYGGQTSYLQSLYGTRANVAQSSFWDQMAIALIGAAGEAAGAYFGASAGGGGGGGGAPGGCWILTAVYGKDAFKTKFLWAWMTNPEKGWSKRSKIGASSVWLYFKVGRQIAWLTRNFAPLRFAFRQVFDRLFWKVAVEW